MNNELLKQLWQLANELEGLILLADNKGQDAYLNLSPILKEKVSQIKWEIDTIEKCINNNSTDYSENSINEEHQEENVEIFTDEEEVDRSHGNLEDDNSDVDSNYSEEPEEDRSHGNLDDDYVDINGNPSDIPQTDDSILDDIIIDDNSDIIYDVVDDEADDEIEIMEDNMEIVDNDVAIVDDNPEDIENSPDDNYDTNTTHTQLTVEGKIAISESKDLRHAFTINDRYRFKRELFANSDIEMTDTINLIAAMTTFSEAKEYFYEDLEWDRNNEDVIDFIAIIENHFASKQ